MKADRGRTCGYFWRARGQGTVEAVLWLGLFAFVVLAVIAVIAPRASELLMAADLPPIDMSNSHPADKHGSAAMERINKCFNERGVSARFTRYSDGRRAEICQMDDGKYAVRILEENGSGGWRLVTQFIKEKLKSIEDIYRYMGNTGYDPIQ